MTSSEFALFRLCVELNQKGLKPSVALLKSKSLGNPAMPLLIKVVRQWKADPTAVQSLVSNHIPEKNTKEKPATLSAEQRIEALEAHIQLLEKRIEQLESLSGH